MRNLQEEAGKSVTTGYLIFSGLATILYALSISDNTYLVFGILLLFTFALAASVGGKGNTDSDLEAIGWSDKNMDKVIPLGIAGGFLALIVGSFIISLTARNTASTVPDFSAAASILPMYTASIIPPTIAVSVNIMAQWLIVAPSEEAAYRILAPFAGVAVFKNTIIAYVFAAILWLATHINAYTMQGTPRSMYLVLFVIAMITTGLFWYTGNAISGIIAHGVFNTGVIIMAGNAGKPAMIVVFVILAVLSYGWFVGKNRKQRSGKGVV
jgi:hypothetical protein